ncbi:MAG: hypothetical protein K0S40_3632 [Actinomycetospora sp.]|jgi:hypothetical protein|nr:hypothetical protein [Actinomycetospora sp.]
MDDTPRHGERRDDTGRWEAHEHAEHLRQRIRSLAASIAESEDAVAEAYEESARLRPHAAAHLEEAARHAREFAARERAQYGGTGAPGTSGGADDGPPSGRASGRT